MLNTCRSLPPYTRKWDQSREYSRGWGAKGAGAPPPDVQKALQGGMGKEIREQKKEKHLYKNV